MQPRQSQSQALPRGCQFTGTARSKALPTSSGAAKLLAKAPSRWKAPIAKFLATKAIAGSALADDRLPDSVLDPAKKGQEVIRWHLGFIYAGLGVVDLFARVLGYFFWKMRYQDGGTPRVSDIQREDVGQPILYTDLMRLVFTGSAAVIRCSANLIILWHAFVLLRPCWGAARMRWLAPVFRILLVFWVIADFLQACIPNVPPDPTEHRITTSHIFFHQMSMYACLLANIMLLVVLANDRDTDQLAASAAHWTLLIMIASLIYYTVNLFKGMTGKATPMGWALIVELSFLMFNVGRALPPRIVVVRGELEKKWWPKFLREGKVRENEDTSARTGSKPLLLSGPEAPEFEALEAAVPEKKKAGYASQRKAKKQEPEDELLQRQRAELAALNAQIRGVAAADTAAYTAAVETGKASKPKVSYSAQRQAKKQEDPPVAEVIINCSQCGNVLKPNGKFCTSCGAPRPEEPSSSAAAPSTPSQSAAAEAAAADDAYVP